MSKQRTTKQSLTHLKCIKITNLFKINLESKLIYLHTLFIFSLSEISSLNII